MAGYGCTVYGYTGTVPVHSDYTVPWYPGAVPGTVQYPGIEEMRGSNNKSFEHRIAPRNAMASMSAADEAKRMSRLHQAWIVDTLETHGGSCSYGELVEVGEKHQCDTVGSMIKYLKNKKVSS